jgi:hypothetical protein
MLSGLRGSYGDVSLVYIVIGCSMLHDKEQLTIAVERL